jgi:hypothetical protein
MANLDEIVVRTALIDARRYHAYGLDTNDAAQLACLGGWRGYREAVARQLSEEAVTARIFGEPA